MIPFPWRRLLRPTHAEDGTRWVRLKCICVCVGVCAYMCACASVSPIEANAGFSN